MFKAKKKNIFSTLIELLKNKAVRNKILFTLFIFVIYRYGCALTIPGIDKTNFTIGTDSVFSIMNLLGGGSLARFSIFALGISPYITAGIVIQLLSMDVIPSLSDWRNEGEKGRKKTERVTRFLTLFLAVIQALSITYGFDKQYGILGTGATYRTYIYVCSTLVAGTMLLTWLGDMITLKGIGNGISMLIFAGIISELPATFYANFHNTILIAEDSMLAQGIVHFAGFVILYLFLILIVTLVECSEKRIIMHNSQALSNTGSTVSYLPVKVNPAGVIPVIFAQSLITAPQIIISFFNTDLYTKLSTVLSLNTVLGLCLYGGLTFLFTFIYTEMVMNPEDMADNLKKQNSFIPTVRPGKDTERYLRRVIYQTAFVGGVILTVLAVLPYVLAQFATVTSTTALGGTGLIVCVGVVLETLNSIESVQIENKYSTGWF